jgi:hypothetical protein
MAVFRSRENLETAVGLVRKVQHDSRGVLADYKAEGAHLRAITESYGLAGLRTMMLYQTVVWDLEGGDLSDKTVEDIRNVWADVGDLRDQGTRRCYELFTHRLCLQQYESAVARCVEESNRDLKNLKEGGNIFTFLGAGLVERDRKEAWLATGYKPEELAAQVARVGAEVDQATQHWIAALDRLEGEKIVLGKIFEAIYRASLRH